MTINYYILDCESSGLNSAYHEVIELGAIRVSDKVQLVKNVRAEHPERSSFDALQITQKTIADISQGTNKEDVVMEFNKFFNEDGGTPDSRCIIGHNIITFDKRFLHALWGKVNMEFPCSLYLDTLQMMRHYVKINKLGKQKVNLHASMDLLGLKKIAAKHDSKNDTRNNFILYKYLIEELKFDVLPFIKNHPHSINNSSNDGEERLNADDLEIID